jgi:CrcB protein
VPDQSRASVVDPALVALGGALGTVARWGLAEAVPGPWATLAVNLSGSLLIGLLTGWVLDAHPRLRLLLGVGLLGGYTTFSTHLLDAHELLPDVVAATAYVAGTLVGCVLLAAAGLRTGRALR